MFTDCSTTSRNLVQEFGRGPPTATDPAGLTGATICRGTTAKLGIAGAVSAGLADNDLVAVMAAEFEAITVPPLCVELPSNTKTPPAPTTRAVPGGIAPVLVTFSVPEATVVPPA
jgi:hypothetical protein